MTLGEALIRVVRVAALPWWRLCVGRWARVSAVVANDLPPLGLTLWHLKRDVLLELVGPDRIARWHEESAAALWHRHVILGVPYAPGFPIDWHLDPYSGCRASLRFAPLMTRQFGGERISAKHIWEFNRHQHWIPLAREYFLHQDARCRDEVFEQWGSWLDQNPPLVGINWASPIELALRIITWTHVLELIGWEECPAALQRRILVAVHQQAEWIFRNRSIGSSANNHRVAESLGLYVAGACFPGLRHAAKWRKRGFIDLPALIRNHVHPDGVHREQATGYHQFVLEMLLVFAVVALARGDAVKPEVSDVIRAMTKYLADLSMDGSWPPPRFGDDDSGRVLPIGPRAEPQRSRELIDCVSRLIEHRAPSTETSELAAWLVGPLRGVSEQPVRPDVPVVDQADIPGSVAYEQGGLFILRSRTSGGTMLTFDCGELGLPPTAAHGHADALAFTLTVAGQQVIVDPGTYTYHTEPAWRSYFRGTRAHNTVAVDGEDQSVSGGPTLWSRAARSVVIERRLGRELDWVMGEHDGYSRLLGQPIHRRAIGWDKRSGLIRIIDDIRGTGCHSIMSNFHFHPEAKVELAGRAVRATVAGGVVIVELDEQLVAAEHVGDATGLLGWYSAEFGRRVATTTISARLTAELPIRFETVIQILPSEPAGVTRRDVSSNPSCNQK